MNDEERLLELEIELEELKESLKTIRYEYERAEVLTKINNIESEMNKIKYPATAVNIIPHKDAPAKIDHGKKLGDNNMCTRVNLF